MRGSGLDSVLWQLDKMTAEIAASRRVGGKQWNGVRLRVALGEGASPRHAGSASDRVRLTIVWHSPTKMVFSDP